MIEDTKQLLSGVVTHLPDLFSSRSDSLPDFVRPTRNDFLTLIETDLITLDWMPAILDSALTTVSGYFLSSISLLVDIPEINIRRTLDKVSTRRDPIESILGAGSAAFKFIGTESYQYGLPSFSHEHYAIGVEAFNNGSSSIKDDLDLRRLDEINQKMFLNTQKESRDAEKHAMDKERALSDKERAALDKERSALQSSLQKRGLDISEDSLALQRERWESDKSKSVTTAGAGRDATKHIEELSNLSTGKTLDVVFERDQNRVTIPVNISLMVSDTDTSSMQAIVSTASSRNTFKERFIRVKNGQLGAFKDLLLCNDLKAESRRVRIQDKSGFYEHMMKRQTKNFLSGLFSMNPSINNASAVLILNEETAKAASLELGGSLDTYKIRQRVFQTTSAMLIYVVDTKWDTVTIYHRGLEISNTVTKNDIKRSSGKGGGSQITDIINAYQAGTAPSM